MNWRCVSFQPGACATVIPKSFAEDLRMGGNSMNKHLGFYGMSAAVLLALLCMAAVPAPAQEGQEGKGSELGAAKSKAQPMPKGGPAPRAADGHPDLSGVWFPGTAGGFAFNTALRRQVDSKVTPEEPPPFQPWAAAKIKAMTSTDYELGRA